MPWHFTLAIKVQCYIYFYLIFYFFLLCYLTSCFDKIFLKLSVPASFSLIVHLHGIVFKFLDYLFNILLMSFIKKQASWSSETFI